MSEYRNGMRDLISEGKWTVRKILPWLIGLTILMSIIGFGLNSLGLIGKTAVEREVFKNSYQYSSAQQAKANTYQAQLTEIDRKLANPSLDKNTRYNLEAQKSSIVVQLNSIK